MIAAACPAKWERLFGVGRWWDDVDVRVVMVMIGWAGGVPRSDRGVDSGDRGVDSGDRRWIVVIGGWIVVIGGG